ncbi:MFS transporter [Pandoraea faecigallinarum]|uniref:MFS transporter n=1 Tax=Pandoraea faecigallinarum TaxID=656179 RepID=A0A0H3WND9_9BURK|nr:MFS transporter [Pandoraea faecigallinarum]AKM29227.1 MFS transporter [Pandoraea faecigallinarum]
MSTSLSGGAQPHATAAAPASLDPTQRNALYRKLTWHIIPFLFLSFIVAYIDRVNVSFAKLEMLADLSLSETVYGAGAGVFFLGYFLFEVPSNLILHRVGARMWIARIMVTWSIISCLTMFTQGPMSFYMLRFLLGVAEAGFFPGIVLYLSSWFPSNKRSQIIALFMVAIPVSGAIGGPLSGWIMQHFGGMHGYSGWQWLFLIEGIASLLVGVAAFFVLQDRIETVKWLSADEKRLLAQDLAADGSTRAHHSVREVFGSAKVWMLGLLYFCIAMGNYGLVFWLPTMIRAAGVANLGNIGMLSAVPSLVSAIAMILVARHADRRNERRMHVAACCVLGAAGMLASVLLADHLWWSMAALIVAAIGINSIAPVFWGIPTAMMGGAGAAAAIALINSTGNLAGFVSPYVIGFLKDSTGQLLPGMIVLACALVGGACIVMSLKPQRSDA